PRPDMRALRGEPIAEAVGDEEPRAAKREPREAAPAQTALHAHSLRAAATVKMPKSSVHCADLVKPASRTSESISPCARRRMIHGSPSRFVSTRAIISTCGCHGWQV